MTRMIQKLALLALLPVASVWGNWCDCGDWSVGADLLIWTHTDCNFNYGEKATNILDSTAQTIGVNTPFVPFPGINVVLADISQEFVKVGYDPGVRVHGRLDTACSYVELSYVWIDLTSSRTTRSLPFEFGPPVFGTTVGESQILASPLFEDNEDVPPRTRSLSAQIRSRYQTIDLEGGRVLASGCWGSAKLFGNFRWVDINHRRRVDAFIPDTFTLLFGFDPIQVIPTPGGPDFNFQWDSEFWGGGFGFGIEGDFDLCCGLHASGRAGIMGLIGEQSQHGRGRTAVQGSLIALFELPAIVEVPTRTCFVPAIDVSVGVGYTCSFECFCLDIDLRYESHYYPHALSWRGNLNRPYTATADQFVVGNIGYSGPSLQFTIGY